MALPKCHLLGIGLEWTEFGYRIVEIWSRITPGLYFELIEDLQRRVRACAGAQKKTDDPN